ncbi:biotin--[acetyl-CoA-carboxylase] ligase [Zhouia sp. PK063]|uniref:biotin--[acetyl-CoA-carboxylase] ligase n=1 Tax=Zhouia sp. PK063 TaxID=3373602 RepID=UPI0037A0642C
MKIIKLNAIDSTNSYLRRLSLENKLEDYTVAVAKYQTQGRGQMGTKWNAEDGKNLTFSIYKKVSCVSKEDQFCLSMAVSLAVQSALSYFMIPQLKIKWPNDILSANKKLCGILIENVIQNGELTAAIVGIGLNVNQTNFEDGLFSASSLKKISGIHYNHDEIMTKILERIKVYEEMIIKKKYEELKAIYEDELFRKDKPSTFKDNTTDELFMGFIKGISKTGMLQIMLEKEEVRDFDLKEVKLLY